MAEDKVFTNKGNFRRWPKWLKAITILLGSLLLLIILLFFGANWYIQANKEKLLKDITEKISDKIEGDLTIGDMEPEFLRYFPNVALMLKNVQLTDSLFSEHKRPLLKAQNVYLKIKTLSFLTPEPEIEKITVANGTIHLFIDENDYSNNYLLKKKEGNKTNKKKKKQLDIDNLGLENIHFTYDIAPKNKQFDVQVNTIDALFTSIDNKWIIKTPLDLLIGQLGFNLIKGGFLKNKTLISDDFEIQFDRTTKLLQIPQQIVKVDDEEVNLSGEFKFGQDIPSFTINLDAESIPLAKGASMLSANIAKHFIKLNLKNPVKAQALIQGEFNYPDTPLVQVFFQTENNVLITENGSITELNLKGSFVNEVEKGKGFNDENSMLFFPHVSGRFENTPVNIDSLKILNIKNPIASCRLYAKFPVNNLNSLLGSSFNLTNGTADFDIKYFGPVLANDNRPHQLNGFLHIKDASISYLPRNLNFKKGNVTLEFKDQDLYFKNINLSTDKSTLILDGIAKDFMSAYFTDPKKVAIHFNITSPLIDLNEFKSFLTARKKVKPAVAIKNKRSAKFNTQIDALLDQGSMYLNIGVKKIIYQNFAATEIKADIDLLYQGINFNKITLNHAGGTIDFTGKLKQTEKNNPFSFNAKIHHVNVDKLFYAFNNFGQETITSDNLKGIFSAQINMNGGFTDAIQILPNSFAGNVNFNLQDGALIGFKPFESIQKIAFKKRNLSNVTFKEIKNNLEMAKGKIVIQPMEIASSALIIRTKGVFAFDKGTDISIEIPLRNPQKEEERLAKGLSKRKGQGITVYLRAKDDEQGNVKIIWDPFNKANSEIDAEMGWDQDADEMIEREDSLEINEKKL